MVTHCNPWSNIKCVDQESGTLAHGEAPVPRELGTPSPSSGTSRLVIRIVSGITIVLVGCVVWYFFNGEFLEGKEEVVAPSCLSPILLFLLVCL